MYIMGCRVLEFADLWTCQSFDALEFFNWTGLLDSHVLERSRRGPLYFRISKLLVSFKSFKNL